MHQLLILLIVVASAERKFTSTRGLEKYLEDVKEKYPSLKEMLEEGIPEEDKREVKTDVCTLGPEGDGPVDCKDILQKNPNAPSGIYTIYLGIGRKETNVYCDMETKLGGWTTILRHYSGWIDFRLSWEQLRGKVGDLMGNYWMGLDDINLSANPTGDFSLLVEMETHDKKMFALYSKFSVDNETNKFKLTVDGFSKDSTAVDGLVYHNGQVFTTLDRDNDKSDTENCAVVYQGPWWHNCCHTSNLLGTYRYTKENKGTVKTSAKQVQWKGKSIADFSTLKSASMKVRRNN